MTDNPPWTVLDGDAPPAGLEAELVTAFADGLDAEVMWTTGNEESLVGALERGELDLVVGGLTAASPWADQAALTTAYTTVTGPEGEPEGHVMAVPLGENGFQVELESFLLERKDVQP